VQCVADFWAVDGDVGDVALFFASSKESVGYVRLR
jgi:hypothetical protein